MVCAFANIALSQRVFHEVERTMIFANSAARLAASLVEAKTAAMNASIETELSKQYDAAIARIAEVQKPKRWLRWLDNDSDWCLGASVASFGGAIYLALCTDVASMVRPGS